MVDMPVLLLCEGRCNPTMAYVDVLVERHAKTDRCAVADDALWAAQRRLTYTAHAMTTPVKARCLACGTERRYGATTWGDGR